MLPSRLWSELTTTDLRAADMASCIAILPVAAVEQHGPHLPLGTDTFVMQGYLDRVLAIVPAAVQAVVLPIQPIGCSIEHRDFAGTLSLAATTALVAWSGLAEAVAEVGCRKLVVVTSHGGNSSIIDILAHELRARLNLLVVMASWQRFGYPEGVFTDAEQRHGIHGGAIETSLMLHLRPDLVRESEARDFKSASVAMARDFTWLSASRPTGFGWMAQDLSKDGAMGDATVATSAKGETCIAHGAAAFIRLLQEVERFDLAGFAPGFRA